MPRIPGEHAVWLVCICWVVGVLERVLMLQLLFINPCVQMAKLDPLGLHAWRTGNKMTVSESANVASDLDYKTYGFTDADWCLPFTVGPLTCPARVRSEGHCNATFILQGSWP